MAKLILVCSRDGERARRHLQDLQTLATHLLPDNIAPNPVRILRDDSLAIAVLNPNPAVLVQGTSVCLGQPLAPRDRWAIPLTGPLDGSYLLIRADADHVEVMTDVVATRTVWYFQNHEVFIASTSQRAIVALLKSFSFNAGVIPWMLSTGCLGPGLSWDTRLCTLQPDSSLVLNRSSWTVAIQSQGVRFLPRKGTAAAHGRELTLALEDTFSRLDLDPRHWILPISGGSDSRAILFLLPQREHTRCITWGSQASLSQPDNDAYVASQLCKALNLKHEYHVCSVTDEPIDRVLERFIVSGEGRIDHIAGYMDGFKIWKTLFESGIHGIIRGDEAFGWVSVFSELDVRRSIGLITLSDYSVSGLLQHLGIDPQTLPPETARRPGESLPLWRDRLYHEFRIPTVLAALNDLKSPYVEIVNPLLARRVLTVVRHLPDRYRTEKRLFRQFVQTLAPAIGFASRPAIQELAEIFRRPDLVETLRLELDSRHAKTLFPQAFIECVLARLETAAGVASPRKVSFGSALKPYIPSMLKRTIRNHLKEGMDFNVLGFRVYLISRMTRLLAEDARTL